MLVTVLLLISSSLFLSLLLTPIVRLLAIRLNFVDVPDNKRKVHRKPIPRVGGIAVAASYFVPLLGAVVWFAYQHAAPGREFAIIKAIVPGAVLIFLTGLADDVFDLKPRNKLIAQTVAVILTVAAGVHIESGTAFSLHTVIAMLGSVVWLLACTNAINLIDGLDGLAGGISLVATIAILIASVMSGNTGLILAAAPLVGALLGFLRYNFNPASIFLGDCGSLLLGFLLGCYGIQWSSAAATSLDIFAPVMVLAVPLLDVALAITRRFLGRQPIFKADRAHMHHRLLALGLTHRQTVLVLYAAAVIAGTLSLSLLRAPAGWEALILVIFAGAVLFGIRELGYAEFKALWRVLFGVDLREEVVARLAVDRLAEGLQSAETAENCWTAIQQSCEQLGIHAVRMQLAGNLFNAKTDAALLRSWAMRIRISKNEWIELAHNAGPVRYSSAIVPFVTTMRQVLVDKSSRWESLNEKSSRFAGALYTTVA